MREGSCKAGRKGQSEGVGRHAAPPTTTTALGASKLLLKLKIDDPLDAFAVHGACGFWGVFAVGLFGHPDYVGFGWDGNNGDVAGTDYAGLFYGGSTLLGAQFVALIIEAPNPDPHPTQGRHSTYTAPLSLALCCALCA